jgi:hypothetical protein
MADPTEITKQSLVPEGITVSFEACNVDGNFFLNDKGTCEIRVKNTDGTQKTVHIASLKYCNQGYLHPLDVIVPATTGEKSAGVFEALRFNDPDNYIQITYTEGVTGLTIAVVEF